MAQYQVETAFYRQADPVIAAARALQKGDLASQEELEAAWSQGANQSAYGRVFEFGLETLRAATLYWQGKSVDLPNLTQDFQWLPEG